MNYEFRQEKKKWNTKEDWEEEDIKDEDEETGDDY